MSFTTVSFGTSDVLLRLLMGRASWASRCSLLPLQSIAVYTSYQQLAVLTRQSICKWVPDNSNALNESIRFWGSDPTGLRSTEVLTEVRWNDPAVSILLDVVALTMLGSASIQSRALPALCAALEEHPCQGVCDAARVTNEVKLLCDWYRRKIERRASLTRGVVEKQQPGGEKPSLSQTGGVVRDMRGRRLVAVCRGGCEAHSLALAKKEPCFEEVLAECRSLAAFALLRRPFLWADAHFGRCKIRLLCSSSIETKKNGNDGVVYLDLCKWLQCFASGPGSAAVAVLLFDESARFASPTLSYAVVASRDVVKKWRFFVIDALGFVGGDELFADTLHAAVLAASPLKHKTTATPLSNELNSIVAVSLSTRCVTSRLMDLRTAGRVMYPVRLVEQSGDSAACRRTRCYDFPLGSCDGTLQQWINAAEKALQAPKNLNLLATENGIGTANHHRGDYEGDDQEARFHLRQRLFDEAGRLAAEYGVAPHFILSDALRQALLSLDPFTAQPALRQALDTAIEGSASTSDFLSELEVPVLPASQRKIVKHLFLRLVQQYYPPRLLHSLWKALPPLSNERPCASAAAAEKCSGFATIAQLVVRLSPTNCERIEDASGGKGCTANPTAFSSIAGLRCLPRSVREATRADGSPVEHSARQAGGAVQAGGILIDTLEDLHAFSALLSSVRLEGRQKRLARTLHQQEGGAGAAAELELYLLSFDTEFDCVVSVHDRCCVLQVSLAAWRAPTSVEGHVELRTVAAAAIDTVKLSPLVIRDFIVTHFSLDNSQEWVKLCHAPGNDLAIFLRDFSIDPQIIAPLVDTCQAEANLRRRLRILENHDSASRRRFRVVETSTAAESLWAELVADVGHGRSQQQNEMNIGLGSLVEDYLTLGSPACDPSGNKTVSRESEKEERQSSRGEACDGAMSVRVSKDKYLKFTCWAQRPLPLASAALDYAMQDCTCLPLILRAQARRLATCSLESGSVEQWMLDTLKSTSAAVAAAATAGTCSKVVAVEGSEVVTCMRLLRADLGIKELVVRRILIWRNQVAGRLAVQPSLMLPPHRVAHLAETISTHSLAAGCAPASIGATVMAALRTAVGDTPFVTRSDFIDLLQSLSEA